MTLINLCHSELMCPDAGQSMMVSWSATCIAFDGGRHRFGRTALVLSLEIVNAESALIEAWRESPDGAVRIQPRQVVRISMRSENGFLHIDAAGGAGRSLIKLSFRKVEPSSSLELVFAQSALLVESGFAAGLHDPPTFRLSAPQHAAALD